MKRRKRLKPMSDKRRAQIPERQRVHAEVLERDDYRCKLAFAFPDQPCFGELHPHHLLKEGQGGSYTPGNLLTACNLHNSMVEDRPKVAALAGLVVHSWEAS